MPTSTPAPTPLDSVDALVALLHEGDRTTAGTAGPDAIAPLDHGLQCAAVLRRHRPDDIELQVAGLVHDLGSIAVPGDPDGHGRHGRALVGVLLGERVGALVELHVDAKRYLVATDETYASRLSPGSVRTLAEQGGPMTASEVAAFEAERHHRDAVALRRADEAAKVPGRLVPPLEDWVPHLEVLAATRSHLRR